MTSRELNVPANSFRLTKRAIEPASYRNYSTSHVFQSTASFQFSNVSLQLWYSVHQLRIHRHQPVEHLLCESTAAVVIRGLGRRQMNECYHNAQSQLQQYESHRGSISFTDNTTIKTSVSKTMRKPPLAKAQTALRKQKIKYGEKRFSIWWMEFFYPAMWHMALGWHALLTIQLDVSESTDA